MFSLKKFIPRESIIRHIRFSSTSHLPTVYALSTSHGRAAIGVIRVTGTESQFVTSVRKLYDPKTSILLDESLAILFNGPKSYTGEDLLELHLHGGNAVIKAVLKAIESLHTNEKPIRYAEAGEFSKRAFQNGRFDLTEIEGIRELIDAETESQRVGALDSMTGSNKIRFLEWREKIVDSIGLLTAIIDFSEDAEIEDIDNIYKNVDKKVTELQKEIDQFLKRTQSSEVLLKGIKLTLLGPPNAGKSSILNKLANEEAAIVSDIAGTTRDIINVPLNIHGYKVVVGDTAGIRDLAKADKIEAEGIKRAKIQAQVGDLVIVVLPANDAHIDEELVDLIKVLNKEKKVLVILNKCDLVSKEEVMHLIDNSSHILNVPKDNFLPVSCYNDEGIDQLSNGLIEEFKVISATEKSDPIMITQRVKDILINDVLNGFNEFKTYKDLDDVVIATESLTQSVEGIGKITGETVGVEEVLGVVFSSFCVGK
ncbi:tRNA modification GTPase [Wickerhamomyces ciferrii]|uniref:tRNA modification GTPase n=1 Tax=Wickerhamomyces ciferrii (strain ATCC 14091 / BCRC 22168 / CBS 111 / JCM 3599 / NBRC 0793 / NRRL Y-1031 F-60-10) TaxID=1206466 RepID=K0KVM5_WICCF|nr:tRNA modification GTPase [Wickerhamomyces ciferrii]CCH45997.1 tRNA modification GTPase [Wickerhamomyces ciferrii]